MKQKLSKRQIWISAFTAGLIMILGASEFSQWFVGLFENELDWRIAGIMLSLISGIGLLLELYIKREK